MGQCFEVKIRTGISKCSNAQRMQKYTHNSYVNETTFLEKEIYKKKTKCFFPMNIF